VISATVALASLTMVVPGVPAGAAVTPGPSIELWLTPRTAAAASFAQAVSTPGNPQFRHYLSPDAWTARFGATKAQAGTVETWLRASGFSSISLSPQRSYVRATAASNRAISLPASLSRMVSGVTGLGDAAPRESLTGSRAISRTESGNSTTAAPAPCSAYYGQHQQGGLPAHFGRTSFPTQVCGYSAGQLRAAYGASMTNTGQGQTIAFVEESPPDPDLFLTLHDYAKVSGLPLPSRNRFATMAAGKGCGGASDVGLPPDPEIPMDVEAAYAMAPGTNDLVVYGHSCGGPDAEVQAYLNAITAILDGTGRQPLASIMSNSWQGATQPASFAHVEHALLVRAAGEGVGAYVAAGDAPGVVPPASDPYAIAVGGTTLGIGHVGNRLFETGWSTGWLTLDQGKWVNGGPQGPSGGGGGGGPSVSWPQPWYQRGVVPAALSRSAGHTGKLRSVPDISADADPATAMAVGVLSVQPGSAPQFSLTPVGGTSLATPLVAGIVAAAQQGSTVPFGFLDPVLYQLAGTSALHDALPVTASTPSLFRGTSCDPATCGTQTLTTFDDQSASMPSYTGQVTLKGYDNMTGLGTPAGQQFITALLALESKASRVRWAFGYSVRGK
jgi:subtilase family serine protease